MESSITFIQETLTAAICAPQLGLSSSCRSVQVIQVHQDSISNSLLEDKEQKSLHPDQKEDDTESITGHPSSVSKPILGKQCGRNCSFFRRWLIMFILKWLEHEMGISCNLHPTLLPAGFPRKKNWVCVQGGTQSTLQQVFWLRWLSPSLETLVDNQLRWSKGSSALNLTLVAC